MSKTSRELAGMLYELADEIRAEEGCTTADADDVEAAALRIDEQTVEIKCLKVERRELLNALEEINRIALGHPYAGSTCGNVARAAIKASSIVSRDTK